MINGTHFQQPGSPHLSASGKENPSFFPPGKFRRAAPDIHHQAALFARHGAEGQPRLLFTGDDLQRKAAKGPDPFSQLMAVFRIPGGAGGKKGNFFCASGPGFLRHSCHCPSSEFQAFFGDKALVIQA